ncbi:MAG: hypothetical protein ACOX08_11735 [Methanobacterium sp.]
MTTRSIPCPNEECDGHLYFWDEKREFLLCYNCGHKEPVGEGFKNIRR